METHLYHCVPDIGGADFPLERDGEVPGHGGGEQRFITEILKELDDEIYSAGIITPRGCYDGGGGDARLGRCEDSPHSPLIEAGYEGAGGRVIEARGPGTEA